MNKKIDDIIEISTDVIDELGPVKAIKKIWDKITENRINSVFKNCANQISGDGNIEEKFKKKLDSFLKTEFGQDTTFSLINKALQAENILTCKMLGVLLGLAINEKRNLTLEEKIIAEGLKTLQDSEIYLLINIVDNITKIPTAEKVLKSSEGNPEKLQEEIRRNSVSIKDFYKNRIFTGNINDDFLSIERLKKLNILTVTSTYEGWAVSSTDGLFKLTNRALQIIQLAKKII